MDSRHQLAPSAVSPGYSKFLDRATKESSSLLEHALQSCLTNLAEQAVSGFQAYCGLPLPSRHWPHKSSIETAEVAQRRPSADIAVSPTIEIGRCLGFLEDLADAPCQMLMFVSSKSLSFSVPKLQNSQQERRYFISIAQA